MSPYLERNDSRRQQFDLRDRTTTLGRHPECEIVVEVGAVSRRHAVISEDAGMFYVEDLNSRNGTYLNNRLVSGREPLRHGDQLKVCDVSFTYLADDETGLPEGKTEEKTVRSDTVMIEDDNASSLSVMSKLDVSLSSRGVEVSASPKAQLEAFLQIANSLGRSISLDGVLPQVLDGLFRIFIQADRGFIVMPDSEGKLIPTWSKFRREDHGEARISRTILRMAMEKKEAILTGDAANDERFDMSESINHFSIRSFMCAPLMSSDDEVLGVLLVDTLDQGKRFQPKDLEILAAVALQAGLAIDNAQLYEQALLQREIERDLELAYEVQRSLLPDGAPPVEGFEFYDFYKAAGSIGGDYFDYITLPDGRLAVVVADVVGHGIAAALLVAKLSAEMKFALGAETDMRKAANRVNRALMKLKVEKFVTMLLMVIDPGTREMVIVNAGHMAPLWRRADGSLHEPGNDMAGLPLGILEDIDYRQCVITLAPGDMLLAYTDGVNECMDDSGLQFGIDRLRDRMHSAGTHEVSEIGEQIIADVREHLGAHPQDDDMCLVGVKVL